jgi:hypothetical protein
MSGEAKTAASPLAALGSMPGLPAAWGTMPVQQDTTRPLERGHRWPLTFYRQVTIADVNARLGWGTR